ncbi:hypothetical protein LXL04_012814 [Taraxacum kok-saghyz]
MVVCYGRCKGQNARFLLQFVIHDVGTRSSSRRSPISSSPSRRWRSTWFILSVHCSPQPPKVQDDLIRLEQSQKSTFCKVQDDLIRSVLSHPSDERFANS